MYSSINKHYIAFIAHVQNCHRPIPISSLKSDVTIVFPHLDPTGHGNFDDSLTFKADIWLLIFAGIFRTSWPKMGKVGENRGRDSVMLTPTRAASFDYFSNRIIDDNNRF